MLVYIINYKACRWYPIIYFTVVSQGATFGAQYESEAERPKPAVPLMAT